RVRRARRRAARRRLDLDLAARIARVERRRPGAQDRRDLTPPMSSLPLAGFTVIALEQAVAVPFATRQLADLGARIIKIERPVGGDFARGYDTTVQGLASHFVWLNRSKESLTLDLKRPEAQLVLSRLLDL